MSRKEPELRPLIIAVVMMLAGVATIAVGIESLFFHSGSRYYFDDTPKLVIALGLFELVWGWFLYSNEKK